MGQANLPLAGCDAHVKAFKRLGWLPRFETSGRNPHVVMTKPEHEPVSIPRHRKEVARGTLQDILRVAAISEEEYLVAFHKKKKRGG